MSMNTTRTSSGAVVLLSCGTLALASGQPFQLNLIDAGGIPGGSLGNPITWSPANLAFNPAAGSNGPPSPGAVFGNPFLAFDSYVAMDPLQPSIGASSTSATDGYACMGASNLILPTATPTTPFAAGSLSGIWFNAGAGGGWIGSGPQHRVFIAQLTLRPGTSEPTTLGVLANIRDFGTADPNGALGTLKFGVANASDNNGLWGQSYYLDLEVRFGPSIFPVTPPAEAFVYSIFVRAIPGPPAALFLLVSGGVLARGRRRLA